MYKWCIFCTLLNSFPLLQNTNAFQEIETKYFTVRLKMIDHWTRLYQSLNVEVTISSFVIYYAKRWPQTYLKHTVTKSQASQYLTQPFVTAESLKAESTPHATQVADNQSFSNSYQHYYLRKANTRPSLHIPPQGKYEYTEQAVTMHETR
jgi:hypothetical protein